MKKINALIFAMAFMSFAFFSCQKTSIEELTATGNSPQAKTTDNEIVIGRGEMEGDCLPTTVSLIAGQFTDAGTVTVTNDESNIYVTYATTGNWVLTETHLYVGDCNAIPVGNNGNPNIGLFPYKGVHSNLTTVKYTLPISALNDCGCIAAHAVVRQSNGNGNGGPTETAWGNGTQINPGGSWAMKFLCCICYFAT